MTQVIDELVVTVGLDPRKFQEGERDMVASFKKGKDAAVEFGRTVEEKGQSISEVMGLARKGALGLVGAFAGGEAAAYIGHIVAMDAATGRFARTIDTSVENLSLWQNMVKLIGGDAAAATSTLSELENAIQGIRHGTGLPEGQFGFLLNRIGGLGGSSADDLLRRIQSYIGGEVGGGRMNAAEAANYLRSVPGMNNDVLNVMIGDFKKLEEQAKKLGGATQTSVEAAQHLTQVFGELTIATDNFIRRLTPLINLFSKPLKDMGKGDVDALAPNMEFEKGSALDKLNSLIWGGEGSSRRKFFQQYLPDSSTAAGGSGGRSSAADREGWIRSMAAGMGINPDDAMRVARSEGFNAYTGDQGTSHGDFQLHVTPGGRGRAVGDQFREQTGLDPSDPRNERAMDEFALRWAAKNGWGDFHGAANSGMSRFQGIDNRKSSSSQSSTTIGSITVVAPNAKDADGIADEIGNSVRRLSMAMPADSGLS